MAKFELQGNSTLWTIGETLSCNPVSVKGVFQQPPLVGSRKGLNFGFI